MLITGSISKKNIEHTINAIIIFYSIFLFYIFFISGERFTQNTGIYALLWCVPFLMIQEKSRSKTLLIGLVYWTIFIQFKRGACVALILSSFTYALSHSFLERNIKATFNCLLIILILLLLFVVSLKIVQQVRPQFFDRRTTDLSNSETIGSGRGSFYPMLFRHYLNSFHSHPMNFFFGFGSRSVQDIAGGYYAHSDWLQILHDFGLLGMMVFFLLHISIIKLIYKSFKAKFKYTPALVMNYTIFFLLNIFSGMVFFPTAIFFGMFISLYYFLWLETTF
jgi:O-antigen ligase